MRRACRRLCGWKFWYYLSLQIFCGLALQGAGVLAFAADAPAAQELGEIVVSARQVSETLEDTAHSVSVVSGQTLQDWGVRSVGEGLRQLPGVVVESLGTRGESLRVFLRGADAGQVLVLIDGVRINNPIDNEANLGLIPVEQIDRIEVLRGSQAVLYGGSAVGGVVNILTRSGSSPHEVRLSLEGGNLAHVREWLGWTGQRGKLRFNLGFSRSDEGGQFRNDAFGETALTQRWDLEATDKLHVTLHSRILLGRKNLARDFLLVPAQAYDVSLPEDAAFINIVTDRNRKVDHLLTTQALHLRYAWNDWLRTELSYGFFLSQETERNSNQGESLLTTPLGISLAPNSALNRVKALRHSVDLRQHVLLPTLGQVEQSLIAGFEFYDERLWMNGELFPGDPAPNPATLGPFLPVADRIPTRDIPGDRQNYAPYFHYHLGFKDRFALDAGFRFDHNSAYSSELSPRVAMAVFFPEIGGKLHGAYGEGFVPPTLLQLFNPLYGNPDLKPQKSQSYEIGYEQRLWEDRLSFYATYFYLDFDNRISRLGTNSDDALSTGVETGFKLAPIPQVSIGATYTYTHTRDESHGGRLDRIPDHVFSAVLSAKPLKQLNLESRVLFRSNHRESFPLIASDGRTVGETLEASLDGGSNPGAWRWDLGLSYDFTLAGQAHPRSIQVFGKAFNLLNTHDEQFFDFPSPGFHFIAGTEILF